MSFKIKINAEQVLNGLQGVVTGVQKRRVSTQFDNKKDVESYPFMLHFTIIKDSNGVNDGQAISIKLKKTNGFKIGQIIDFSTMVLKNGEVHLWANQQRYVQVSLKGDSLDVR